MFTKQQYMDLDFEKKKEVMEWKAKFHKKKAKATTEMKRIPKNGWNDFHKYYYARESDVKEQVGPILYENHLSISDDLLERKETEVDTKSGKATKTEVKMEFTITDTETGYFEIYTLEGVAIDNGDKGIYKAYSNTIKYFLFNEFLIPTGDDVENDSPEMGGQKQPNNGGKPPKNNKQQNKPNKPNNQPKGEKPRWKRVMDLEDQIAQMAGIDKQQIRNDLELMFGKMGKYKDMEEGRIKAIGNELIAWKKRLKSQQQKGAGQ